MDLKRCPFCGSEADVIEIKLAPMVFKHAVQCTGCGIKTKNVWDKKKAITAWNHRIEENPEISSVHYTEEQMGYDK